TPRGSRLFPHTTLFRSPRIEDAEDDALALLAASTARGGAVPDRRGADQGRPGVGIEWIFAVLVDQQHVGQRAHALGLGRAQFGDHAVDRVLEALRDVRPPPDRLGDAALGLRLACLQVARIAARLRAAHVRALRAYRPGAHGRRRQSGDPAAIG